MLLKRLSILVTLLSFLSLQSQNIKVMTYNIKYDNVSDTVNNWHDRKEKLVELIEHYNPSFIGIQEALHQQVIYIDNTLTDYAYIGVGRDDGKSGGEYSEIHYDSTLYEVLQQNTFWLSETPDKISRGWDAALERICTYGLFKNRNTGKQIWVFNTHFDHKGEKARAKSAALIVKKIKQINSDLLPVILTGDFNSTPDQEPIQSIKTFMTDGKEITHSPFYGPEGTFNGFDANMHLDHRIDYIFVKNLTVENYVHIDDRMENLNYISDHLPVLITISEK